MNSFNTSFELGNSIFCQRETSCKLFFSCLLFVTFFFQISIIPRRLHGAYNWLGLSDTKWRVISVISYQLSVPLVKVLGLKY